MAKLLSRILDSAMTLRYTRAIRKELRSSQATTDHERLTSATKAFARRVAADLHIAVGRKISPQTLNIRCEKCFGEFASRTFRIHEFANETGPEPPADASINAAHALKTLLETHAIDSTAAIVAQRMTKIAVEAYHSEIVKFMEKNLGEHLCSLTSIKNANAATGSSPQEAVHNSFSDLSRRLLEGEPLFKNIKGKRRETFEASVESLAQLQADAAIKDMKQGQSTQPELTVQQAQLTRMLRPRLPLKASQAAKVIIKGLSVHRHNLANHQIAEQLRQQIKSTI